MEVRFARPMRRGPVGLLTVGFFDDDREAETPRTSARQIERNVQHAVIWRSLNMLKDRGYQYAEMGQIDGVSVKEQNIGKFKQGFGGEAKPFVIARRVTG